MKLLADECCDAPLVAGLRADGHDVLYAKESFPGAPDNAVLQAAVADGRLLLTEDKDFGELVVRLRLPAYGVILLRLDPADSIAKLERLRQVLQHGEHRLVGRFVVVGADKARSRLLASP